MAHQVDIHEAVTLSDKSCKKVAVDDAQHPQNFSEESVESSEVTRCGKFTFKAPLSTVTFHAKIFSFVSFDVNFFLENFYSCGDGISASAIDIVQLNIGMQVKLAPEVFPAYEDSDFIIFGFLEDKKNPSYCRAIVAGVDERKFGLVHITDLLLPAEPIYQARFIEDLFQAFKNWTQLFVDKKYSYSEMCLSKCNAPPTQKSAPVVPTRMSMPRTSKAQARQKILELSPSKCDIEEHYHQKRSKSVAKGDDASKEFLSLQKKNVELQHQIGQLQKTVAQLQKRVTNLESSTPKSVSKARVSKKVKMEEEDECEPTMKELLQTLVKNSEKTQAPVQHAPPPQLQTFQMPAHMQSPHLGNMVPLMFGAQQNNNLLQQPLAFPAFAMQQGTPYFLPPSNR